MSIDLPEKIFKDVLTYYLSLGDISLEKHLTEANTATKEELDRIDDLQIIIYSNDHPPPHFHVKTKDLRIDAKFKIENGELLSGEIGSKDLKKIKAFYLSPKGKIALELLWRKFHSR